MTNLRDTLTSPDRKPAVVSDLAALIENQIANLTGLTGIAAKTAFATAKKSRPDVVQRAANAYLGSFADALDPFWQQFTASQGTDFGADLAANKAEVTAALERAMDAEAPSSGSQRAMFDRFKPQVVKMLGGALPDLGALVQKHA